jgi:DNA-binding MarR family transcriptional regulator
MQSRKDDIRFMVAALMAIVSSTTRAGKKGRAATLSLLRAVAAAGSARPSDLAAALDVHQSTVSRQIQSLDEQGLIALTADAEDRRSCFATMTPRGRKHLEELYEFGLSRFELFLSDWSQEEIHTLGKLLAKLEASKTRVVGTEPEPPGRNGARQRRWQEKS